MNSTIASNINGGAVINKQVVNGSYSSLLMSSIEFSLTEIRTNFIPPSNQEKFLIKLIGKDDMFNGQNKNMNWYQNKNPIENSAPVINGNRENNASEDSIPVAKVQLYTGNIHVEWNQVYKIGAGLNNLGNTCFMNTVIQCLTYCPPLANYLLHDNDHSSKCTITGFCMMCLLQRHMKRAIGKTGEVIKPLDVYQRLKLIAKHFQFGRQEDAHEFLRYVIDHLWKACLLQTNGVKLDSASKETTVINKIFGGYHRSQVICMRCKKRSNTFDHFMDFILDIKQNVMSLEKALEKFTQPELLQQENCYKCPKCKMKVEAQKRFSVYQIPTVATFQLKRFDYNRTFGGKITKQVTYPEKLNLRPYMSEPKGNPVWYRLYAVLVHSGPSCNSGHYYCYVKNSNGFWYIMDDQRVHQVSLNQVLNQSAYVLFYIRMESGERPPLKKCLDNKSSYMKGVISNNNLHKVSEMSNMKPVPLSEKSPFVTSNNQVFSSPNPVKKFNITTCNREKVSFGLRPGLSPMAFNPLKNKNILCIPRGGLVPYVEDSSESSDTSESNHSAIQNISEVKQKNGSFESSPCLEIKAKLSKSIFNSIIPKVAVSRNWIVTPESSETASSCASICGINSTAHWQVTAMEDVDSSPKTVQNKDFEAKEFSDSILKPPKYSLKGIEEGEQSSNPLKLNGLENGSLTKKCNFRKQQYKSKSQLLEIEEAEQISFKRKSCDSYSKAPKDSSLFEHDENKYNPLPKKVKCSEKSPFLMLENNIKNCKEILEISCNSLENGILQPQQQQSVSNGDTHSQTSVTNSSNTSKDSELSHYHNNLSLSHLPENRKSEDSSNRDCTPTKGKHKDKESFPKSSHHDNQKLFINQVKNQPLYGTEVPTWRRGEYYRPSVVPSHEHRRYFDDYDEEFDRGKVRKSKMKDHYRYFSRKNPFQKHADRYNERKFCNSHRKYSHDSHYNWKPKQKDSYRNRYNQNYHQRHHY